MIISNKSTKLKQASIDKIKRTEAFLAVVTENFINDETCIEEYRLAEDLNKPMYAIIRDPVAWAKIENSFMWRKTFLAEPGFEIKIKEDLAILRGVKDL